MGAPRFSPYRNRGDPRLLHQEHRPGALDLASDFPVQIGWHAGYSARQNLPALSYEFTEEVRVLVINRLKSDVDTPSGHRPICSAKI